jgi:hypothetical protein
MFITNKKLKFINKNIIYTVYIYMIHLITYGNKKYELSKKKIV